MPLYLHYSDYLYYFSIKPKKAEGGPEIKKEAKMSEVKILESFFAPSCCSHPGIHPKETRDVAEKCNAEGSLEQFTRKLIFFILFLFLPIGNDVRVYEGCKLVDVGFEN